MFSTKIKSNQHHIPRFFFYLGLLTIGQTIIRPALSFTISDWFFLTSFLLTTAECLLKRKFEIKFPPYMFFGLFLFSIGGILSSTFAIRPLESALSLIKYLYLIAVWFWLGNVLLRTHNQIRTAIILWATSSALSGLGAIAQLIWIDILSIGDPLWNRMAGFTEHVNDLGGLTSIALIPSIMIITKSQNNLWLFFYSSICTFFISIGLLLSVSLSGILALIAGLLFWLILSRLKIKNILISILAVSLFCCAISIQNFNDGFSFIDRFLTIFDNGIESETLQTRIGTYIVAWETIKAHPLLGVGLGPDVSLTQTGHAVHNIFLLNWYQSGLFGLIGISIVLYSIALQACKGIVNPVLSDKRDFGIALFASYIAFLVLGIAQPIFYNRFGWISAALLLSLYSNYDEFNNIYSKRLSLHHMPFIFSNRKPTIIYKL